jgi:hypothetical protein
MKTQFVIETEIEDTEIAPLKWLKEKNISLFTEKKEYC